MAGMMGSGSQRLRSLGAMAAVLAAVAMALWAAGAATATGATTAKAAKAASAASAARAATTARSTATVQPLIANHIVVATQLKTAPTTAYCETNYGIACYQADQLQRAYDLAPLFAKGINGAGQTIVIVDAFGSPSIAADLKTFDQAMNLPDPPSLKVITPEGPITTTPSTCTSSYSSTGPDSCSDYYGWTDETSLDVEWSHAMAPDANIVLVETPVTETEGVYGMPQIIAAENYVIDHHIGQVISQSFGSTEQAFTSPGQIYSLRSAYINAAVHGVSVLASSGDDGSTDSYCDPASGCQDPDNVYCCSTVRAIDWPASDPLVTAVGGTQLHLDANGNRTAPDNVWADLSTTMGVTGPAYSWGASGGGLSTVFKRPLYQLGVASAVGDSRGTPDISMSAAVDGAVDYYDSTDPSTAGWSIVGGTSEASPLFSGIVALADQAAGHSVGYLNPLLYTLALRPAANGIVPISSGSNTYTFCQAADVNSDSSCQSSSDLVTVPGFTANGSYNDATGLGTVDAAKFVPALARLADWGL